MVTPTQPPSDPKPLEPQPKALSTFWKVIITLALLFAAGLTYELVTGRAAVWDVLRPVFQALLMGLAGA